jgi:hypothetical protein
MYYLNDIIIRPLYDIHLNFPNVKEIISQRPYISIADEMKNHLASIGLEAIIIDVGRWSKRLSGRIILLLSKTADDKLSHRHNDKNLVLEASGSGDSSRINPYRVIQNYAGNRIVVNGFRMSLKKLVRVVGGAKKKLPAIFDVSVLGDPDVIYDVSRGRIFGPGSSLIKNELRHCLLTSLTEQGILDRMTEETRRLTEMTLKGLLTDDHISAKSFDRLLDENLLTDIQQRLPQSSWPKDIHKTIAKALGISYGLSHRAITILIDLGRVTKPETQPE